MLRYRMPTTESQMRLVRFNKQAIFEEVQLHWHLKDEKYPIMQINSKAFSRKQPVKKLLKERALHDCFRTSFQICLHNKGILFECIEYVETVLLDSVIFLLAKSMSNCAKSKWMSSLNMLDNIASDKNEETSSHLSTGSDTVLEGILKFAEEMNKSSYNKQ